MEMSVQAPMKLLLGGCLCGAVRYRAEGVPLNVCVCHCRLCQKALGAAFNSRAVFPRDAVAIEGRYATFPSSPDLDRGFCPTCGTTLFSFRPAVGTVGVTLGSLDDPAACPAPALQLWTDSCQTWAVLGAMPSSPRSW